MEVERDKDGDDKEDVHDIEYLVAASNKQPRSDSDNEHHKTSRDAEALVLRANNK